MFLKQRLLIIVIFLLVVCFALVSYTIYQDNKIKATSNFEECSNAGYPVMESFPARCVTPDGRSFTQELTEDEKQSIIPPVVTPNPEAGSSGAICKNQCGDGVCQDIVCLGTGCTCGESKNLCPADCSE